MTSLINRIRVTALLLLPIIGVTTLVMMAGPACQKPIGYALTESDTAKVVSPEVLRLQKLRQEYVSMKFGHFIVFNMSTFERCCCPECVSVFGEWATGAGATAYPNLFQPKKLDAGKWAKVAKDAGCKYQVLVAKHHDGFCLWDSKYTTHDVGSSTWGGGKRDIVKEYVDSSRAYGLKVGIYYSIWDHTSGESISFIKNQLTELLTNYGPITCLWFDGWAWQIGYRKVSYDSIRNLVRSIQPNCLLIENNHLHTLDSTDIMQYEFPVEGLIPATNKTPGEGNTPIRSDDCWFWHPVRECELKSASRLAAEIAQTNAGNATYLLCTTPDTTGLIPDCQVQRMKEVGQLMGIR